MFIAHLSQLSNRFSPMSYVYDDQHVMGLFCATQETFVHEKRPVKEENTIVFSAKIDIAVHAVGVENSAKLHHTALHCNTLQPTATLCNTLQQTTVHAIGCNNKRGPFHLLKKTSVSSEKRRTKERENQLLSSLQYTTWLLSYSFCEMRSYSQSKTSDFGPWL